MIWVEFLVLLIVVGVCGAIGRAIIGYSQVGFPDTVALNLIGAFVGVWVADKLGLPRLYEVRIGDTSFSVIWSIIGAGLMVAVISVIFYLRRRKTITF